MENLKIRCYFALIVCLLFFTSCDSTEKDWENAKTLNSKTEYQNFINKHSSSSYVGNAKISIDSLEWITIIKAHSIDSLELFIKNHTSSNFLKNSNGAMDSIDWNIAFYSRDTIKLRKYIEKYPYDSNSIKAKEVIWEIKWPPVAIDKANSISITNKKGTLVYGEVMFQFGEQGISPGALGRGPKKFLSGENLLTQTKRKQSHLGC